MTRAACACVRCSAILTLGLITSAAAAVPGAPVGNQVDRLIDSENSGKSVQTAPVVDDMAYLRRVTVDLIGRIPTEPEIQAYLKTPAATRRGMAVERLLEHPRFADRWTVFYADLLRIRTNATGGQELLAYVHQAISNDKPWDELSRELVATNGKASAVPPAAWALGDDADPMALAGATAQVFMGIRIACAECHDHPFDKWTQEQFYGLAAYYGKTRRVESRLNNAVYTTESGQMRVMWPPQRQQPAERQPVDPAFPFELVSYDTTPRHIAKLNESRAAAAAKRRDASAANSGADIDALIDSADSDVSTLAAKPGPAGFDVEAEARREVRAIDTQADLYRASELRARLADLVTDPSNRYFARSFVNRVWAELLGRGFVEPVDDFSELNPPSHPKTLDHIADEFIASGYSFRALVRLIVTSETYQRDHMPVDADPLLRVRSEAAFTATPVRRMIAEVLYDSIVTAGHLEDYKWAKGENQRTVRERVRVAVGSVERPAALTQANADQPQMMMQNGQMMARPRGYDLERAVELDFNKVLAEKPEAPRIEMLAVKSAEEIEAERMAMEAAEQRAQRRTQYKYEYVERTFDDNPIYGTAMRMATPAPPAHFVRVFGQTDREALGTHRDNAPTMRQALMMLNGKMTHEASRVGSLEPMRQLVEGPKADLEKAIRLAYREILTREPKPAEIEEAKAIIEDAQSDLDGMADLRWVLLNCHEFRYLP